MVLVSGGGEVDDSTAALAEQLGAEIARAGATLLTGGLGGAMEAASRGAKKAGGTTVAVIPGADSGAANRHVDIVITSGMSHGRNVILVHSADAVIGLPGSFGTLSEVALALVMGKPVVSLGCWRPDEKVIVAADPPHAVRLALDALRLSRQT
jgi:uncharacterized protein (TIGR00725 family)